MGLLVLNIFSFQLDSSNTKIYQVLCGSVTLMHSSRLEGEYSHQHVLSRIQSGLPAVREKSGKTKFFKVSEKSGNFTQSRGILGFIGKVMEKSGDFVEFLFL